MINRGNGLKLSIAVGSAVASAIIMVAPAPAMAASHLSKPRGGGGGGGGSTPSGYDVSWPQCGQTLPTGQAFAIVGVNHGLANNTNTCVGPELSWAAGSTGSTTQPKASVYVNTADPGAGVGDWPKTGSNVEGTCAGGNTTACAWQYGYNMAQADLGRVGSAAATYPWWLDVETGNSWQSGASGLAMNVADLQGMEAALQAGGVTAGAGIYSTSYQWGVITGGDVTDFDGVPDWIPGARTESGAQSNCSLPAFTGSESKVTVTQWTGPLDNDWACP